MNIFIFKTIEFMPYSDTKRNNSLWLLVIAILVFNTVLTAQTQIPERDTTVLSLQEAEKMFIDSNLVLLAAHYNVDAQKALIEQAKLWDNPVLNTDQVIAASGKFFPYGKNTDGSFSGQYFIQVQQLIKTAGKRGKLISLARTNAKLSELQLQDVLRNLRYQLHSDYYTLIQQLETRHIYERQLQQLQKLITGMKAQLDAGNLSQKDYLRIEALVVALQQDMTDLDKSISDNENELKTLLQVKNGTFIKPQSMALNKDIGSVTTVEELTEIAKQNNPGYQLQQTQTVFQQQNLSYQKALRTPDITLGPNFDRNSNFAPNYIGLGISLPIPVFNKNQGNIKSAEYSIKQQQSLTGSAETELRNNISNAYAKLALTLKLNNQGQKEFYTKYQSLYENIVSSYQQRQISLLEFIDFFNDYTNSQQRQLQQKLNLQLVKEELNYHAGIDIIK